MNSPKSRWILAFAVLGLAVLALTQRPGSQTEPASRQELLSSSEDSALRIVPDPPQTYHALRVVGDAVQASMASQLHGESDEVGETRLVWSVGGQVVHEGRELPSHLFHKGDEVVARVESTDDTGQTVVHGTARTTVANSRPQVRSVTLQREPDDPTWVRAHVRATDADEDRLSLEYAWRADGQELERVGGDRASTTGLASGARLTVEVTAYDGEARSDPLASRPVVLDNQPPRFGPRGTPRTERAEDGTLVAHMPVEASDADGHAVEIRLVDAPEGFRWDAASQSVVWTVTSGEETVDLTLEARDTEGAAARRTIRVRR